MSVVDDYLKNVDEPNRDELERIRRAVKQVAPEAEEVINYGMPGFKYHGKYLMAFAAFKDHLSLFPGAGAVAAFRSRLSDFKLSKGTIQFTLEHPISDGLIKEIIAKRVREIG